MTAPVLEGQAQPEAAPQVELSAVVAGGEMAERAVIRDPRRGRQVVIVTAWETSPRSAPARPSAAR